MNILKITAYDHFGSDDVPREDQENTGICVGTFIGEKISENQIYIYLRSFHTAYTEEKPNDHKPVAIHGVVKSTIILIEDYVKVEPEWNSICDFCGKDIEEQEKSICLVCNRERYACESCKEATIEEPCLRCEV